MFAPDGPTFRELFRQAMSSTRGGYDLLAPKFDSTPFRTPDALLQCVVQQLVAGPSFATALDVCCGTGAVMGHIKPLCQKVVGIDFSPGMLAEAERRLASVEGGDVGLVRGDAMALPFDGGFDLVTCFGAFGHVLPPDQPRFLEGIYRALEPGGRFVFVTGDKPRPTHPAFWMSHGFNAAMKVRNALFSPPFVMFYLTFPLPVAVARLVEAGFQPEVRPLGWDERPGLCFVAAHKPS
ncbi:MAG: class I SAM-dependent methyltransferase [Myxococcales bacterium]|nr:class I SAM-dependent methyltransferase [Myxococcales bacterium]